MADDVVVVPSVIGLASLALDIADRAGALPRKRWSLTNADGPLIKGAVNPLYTTVIAQYDTDVVSEHMPTSVRSIAGMGDSSVGTTPGANGADSWSISAKFVAGHAFIDIKFFVDQLRKLRTFDVNLGRIPLVRFEYAGINELVWISNLDVQYGGHFRVSGFPKTLTAEITLTKAKERLLDSARRGKERSTFYHTLRAGETFEFLAVRYLGRPHLSPLIRRTNPGVNEVEGQAVKILPRTHSKMRGEVVMAAPCFAADGWEDVFETLAEERL